MENKLKQVDIYQIKDNPFKLIADDWFLVTAGSLDSYNTMTASWGTIGELWHKKICICFVRPQRYTYKFMEASDSFTLSFFDEKYRDTLKFCGTKSGRDYDKAEKTGLTPIEGISKSVYFNEARLVLECRKLYFDDLKPENFIDPDIQKEYPQNDYHRFYIGEIINCLMR